MRNVIAGIMIFIATPTLAQYFQFSQYNFTPQRINPALVASSDYATLDFDFRSQSTDGGFHLTSNILSLSYPFLSRSGRRWSGVGISLMDDRTGQSGIFSTQEIALSYAASIEVARFQSLSLGVKILYQNRKMDLNGLYTGSQFIPDRGFDANAAPGEDLGAYRNIFMTFSAGLHWQKTDRKGIPLASWDISFFDFNRPDDSFIKDVYQLTGSWVAAGSIRAYHRDNMSIYPQILYTQSASNHIVNAGVVFRADLKSTRDEVAPHVDMITKYIFGRSGLLGLQFHNERFSIGFSYDFPMFVRNVSNLGAFEVGLTLRRLVKRGKKNRKDDQVTQKPGTPVSGRRLGATVGVKKPAVRPDADSVKATSKTPKDDLGTRLKQKQDSVITLANAGQLKYEPLILERATLHFNFRFNSSTPDQEATAYLDELAAALIDNPGLHIKLVGHTDNVGSAKFNLRLSLQRAGSMKEYLVGKGVPAERISVDGKGMTEPLNTNETEEHRSLNRRVELTILYN